MSISGVSALSYPHIGDKKPERRIFFIQLGISDTCVKTSAYCMSAKAGRQLVLLIDLYSSAKEHDQIIRSE
jgi:hypothetical protein